MGVETLAVLGIGSSLIGAGVQAMGAMSQSSAQAASANYMAQVARNNQIIAQQNSESAINQGYALEQRERQKTAALIGEITATQGARNVLVSSPSSVLTRSSAAETGELDALTIRYNAGLEARNQQIAANSAGAQAQLYSAQAQYDLQAGMYGVGTSILGGASSVSDKWLKYQTYGVPGFGGGGFTMPY